MVRPARRVLFITRHGETDWNAAGRWQGHTDVPLNANGYRQARAVGVASRALGVRAVVTSDLSRAYETGRVAAEQIGLTVAYADPGLRERAFGPFEGLTRDECSRLHPAAWRAWVEEQRPPEGAEGRAALATRVIAAIGRAAQAAGAPDGAVLVVTHGGALRAAVGTATDVPPPPIANGA
ncbi:MAG: histidine phosphatase family protein, partial [Polyangiaceae bacterium]|nr:histidine phosphatase family protein [Polyangiaceae bacterium]